MKSFAFYVGRDSFHEGSRAHGEWSQPSLDAVVEFHRGRPIFTQGKITQRGKTVEVLTLICTETLIFMSRSLHVS